MPGINEVRVAEKQVQHRIDVHPEERLKLCWDKTEFADTLHGRKGGAQWAQKIQADRVNAFRSVRARHRVGPMLLLFMFLVGVWKQTCMPLNTPNHSALNHRWG